MRDKFAGCVRSALCLTEILTAIAACVELFVRPGDRALQLHNDSAPYTG